MTRQKHLGKINANFRYLHISILEISQKYMFNPLSSNIFLIIVHVSCHNITNFFNRRHWRQKRNHKKRSKVKAGCFHPVYPPSEDLGDNKCFLLQWLSHVTHVTIFGREMTAPKTKKATSIYISQILLQVMVLIFFNIATTTFSTSDCKADFIN